jgi:glucose-6-phosphate dehydrogenase assembly protein OpcA
MPTVIEPEKILKDLNQLWDRMDSEASGSGGVLRACAMTLAVVAEDDEDAAHARRTIGMLMHDHPSRALVLKAHDGREMDARVFAECWMPFGGQQQICAEGVEITAPPHRFPDVAKVVLPLRAPDLPVVLWCRGDGAFTLRAFDYLFPLADKIIFDSAGVSGASAALAFLRSLHSRGQRVADLEWARLTGWRQNLAHLFEGETLALGDVTSIRLNHGGSFPTVGALYFESWIGQALPAAHVRFEGIEGGPGLCSVTFSSPKGDLSLTRTPPHCIEVKGLGQAFRRSLPPQDEASLMREELKILGPDPIYESLLR